MLLHLELRNPLPLARKHPCIQKRQLKVFRKRHASHPLTFPIVNVVAKRYDVYAAEIAILIASESVAERWPSLRSCSLIASTWSRCSGRMKGNRDF